MQSHQLSESWNLHPSNTYHLQQIIVVVIIVVGIKRILLPLDGNSANAPRRGTSRSTGTSLKHLHQFPLVDLSRQSPLHRHRRDGILHGLGLVGLDQLYPTQTGQGIGGEGLLQNRFALSLCCLGLSGRRRGTAAATTSSSGRIGIVRVGRRESLRNLLR